jgi:Zn-dependent M16 (insulinase) family peptidase
MGLKITGENNLQKLMNFLPEKLIIKQVQKEWKAKTKGLTKLPVNTKKINSLKIPATKKVKYKGKTCFNWLCELEKQTEFNKQYLEFIIWFQDEYCKKSFELITGKKWKEL